VALRAKDTLGPILMRRRVAIAGCLFSALAFASPASADPNDLALNRLSYYQQPGTMNIVAAGGCGTASAGFAQCAPDNQLFANLINELGGALAPPLLAPARTTGYNGLYIGYENTITGINGAGDYWHRGTIGNPPPGTGNQGTGTEQIRTNMPNQLFVSHLHVRKGLPYGFELGTHVNWLHDSSMVSLGLDIRWALFEGFHSGIGYLPDFAVRGSVNTLVGNQQLYLTIVGIDAMISKPFSLGGVATLTPYLGGQALMILGDSTVIDGTPQRSSYEECTRRHVAVTRDAMNNPTSSDLICDSGSNAPMTGPNDSRNEMVFMATRILRVRGAAGLRLRIGYFSIGGEFLYDLTEPFWLNGNDSVAGQGRPTATGQATDVTIEFPRQWQVTFGGGVQF
jgi:hypothetical protein